MKYFTRYFLNVALWLSILILPCSSFGFQNEPDNFRGIKWGTNINELSDMYFVESQDKFKIYKRKNDKMKIASAEIDNISYFFYKKRFFTIFIQFKGLSNFQHLKSTLFQLYGPPNYVDSVWHGTSVGVILEYYETLKKGAITYTYTPIALEYGKDEEEAAKKGVDDL